MNNFFPGPGCIYKVSQEGGSDKGYYNVDEFEQSDKFPVLWTGVNIEEKELFSPVRTLSKSNVLYTFGNDFGTVAIHGEILLGPAGGGGKEALEKVINFYQEKRLSVYKNKIKISAGVGYAVYLTGLVIGSADPEYQTQQFSYIGFLAEPPK
jgi:hypothetical protein